MILNYNKNSNRAGIYTITNLKTKKVLVCNAYNFKRKWARDREALQNKKFFNREFQRDYYQSFVNNQDDDFIVFDVVEHTRNVKKEDRKIKEILYIKKYKDAGVNLYNREEPKKEKPRKLSKQEKENNLFCSLFGSKLKETISNLLKFRTSEPIVFEYNFLLIAKLKELKINLKAELEKLIPGKFKIKEIETERFDFFWKASIKEIKRSYCQSIKVSDLKIK